MEDYGVKVLFYLKKNVTDKDGRCPLMGRIRVGDTMAQFGTKLTVRGSLWDSKSGRLTGKGGHATRTNARLNKINVAINNAYRELLIRRSVATAEQVKHAFQGMSISRETLLDFFAQTNDEFRKRIGIDRAYESWRGYKTVLKSVRTFIRYKYGLGDIPLSSLTYSFIDEYDSWLRIDKKIKPATIVGYTVRLCHVVRQAVSLGIIIRYPFAGYKAPREVRGQRYLTDVELRKMMGLMPDKRNLELTRDMFLFSCFTGLAWVDVYNLKRNNLFEAEDGVMWIHTKRKKTGGICKIPLLDIPLEIIDKYKDMGHNGKLLPVPSNSILNCNLKKIAGQCGIDRNITFHMARHTYASEVTLSHGVPLESVSSLLGHSDIGSTQIYAKVTDDKIRFDMEELEFRIENKFKIAL